MEKLTKIEIKIVNLMHRGVDQEAIKMKLNLNDKNFHIYTRSVFTKLKVTNWINAFRVSLQDINRDNLNQNALVSKYILKSVNNAIKYSSENSKVIIDAQKVSDKLQINIKDQGKGLSVHEIEQLLSQNKENISFGSNSNSCNGFGINICKYLAKFHSGELYFESKKDNGTKASLILPC